MEPTNHDLSVRSGASSLSSPMSRQKILKLIITKSLVASLRDLPDDTTLTAMVAAWAEILGNVPADQLNTCYQAAWSLPDHKPGFPVTADELLAAWRNLQHERATRPRYFLARPADQETS